MLQAAKLWIGGGQLVTIWKYNKWKKPTENDTNAGYTATGCVPLCRHITHYPPCMNLLPSPISPALPSAEADTITRTFLCDLSSRSPAMELWRPVQCRVGNHGALCGSVMLISLRCRLVRVSCLLTPLPLHRGEKNGAYTYFDILYSGIMEFDVKQIHRQINMTLTLNIQIV